MTQHEHLIKFDFFLFYFFTISPLIKTRSKIYVILKQSFAGKAAASRVSVIVP